MTFNLSSLDSNQIINRLDECLAQGYSINDIVSALDDIRIIGNYNRLIEKGATNINLVSMQDLVDPIVVVNNLDVFKEAGVPVDLARMVYRFSDSDMVNITPENVKEWVHLGADPQKLAIKYLRAQGCDIEVVLALVALGAEVDETVAEKLIDNLLNDEEYLTDNFHSSGDIDKLRLVGADDELIHKLLKRLSEFTAEDETASYGGRYPTKLDINENGRQAAKIFFVPQVQVISPQGGRELDVDWAGRVLPGQTVSEGIAAELKAVYGYTGKFEWRNPYFKDWIKDNQGKDVQRFGLYVTLYPTEADHSI